MSRYVDLDGLSWDGKPIASKIQEVKTRCGYMQGITVGWLWGDNVPHIDLAEHDAKVKSEAIEEYKNRLLELCDCGIEQADCTGGNCYKCMDNQVDYSSIIDLAEELKGAI